MTDNILASYQIIQKFHSRQYGEEVKKMKRLILNLKRRIGIVCARKKKYRLPIVAILNKFSNY